MEKMKAPRILIGAIKSGSGKTLVTCALLQALKEGGKRLAAFKCGPDYIDPMFHEKVLGVASKNLDTFFTQENTTRHLLLEGMKDCDMGVIEGVMGLYDGLGGIREETSSYHLAKVTGTPIVLVIDVHGMGRSVLPLILGFLQYDTCHLIQGIILNKITGMFYQTLMPFLKKHIPVPVLGYFPREEEFHLESRHLGLKMPHEVQGLKEQVKRAAGILKRTVDMMQLERIAQGAVQLKAEEVVIPRLDGALTIGIARDEAFCFYYEDNLSLLCKAGARLVSFSPLHDTSLPEGLHGMILGGGYPENYAGELSANRKMRESLREALSAGMPSIAECGGFMYLHETMEDMEGQSFPMVGMIPGHCYDTGKLVRFGYIEITEREETFLPRGSRIKGHEFHHYDSSDNGTSCVAQKPVTGREWKCVHTGRNHWWGFPHLYYYSDINYALRFLERVKEYGKASSPSDN